MSSTQEEIWYPLASWQGTAAVDGNQHTVSTTHDCVTLLSVPLHSSGEPQQRNPSACISDPTSEAARGSQGERSRQEMAAEHRVTGAQSHLPGRGHPASGDRDVQGGRSCPHHVPQGRQQGWRLWPPQHTCEVRNGPWATRLELLKKRDPPNNQQHAEDVSMRHFYNVSTLSVELRSHIYCLLGFCLAAKFILAVEVGTICSLRRQTREALRTN